ncbi:MAG: glycosyltransferase family 2 protein, partial [Paludibacteraceae bacterium]|nr:glycosyltransferase family 2 protein [Paludibacteraceae bacterium]
MKKVTVIMPNYNHACYLKERMDSILAQDYPEFEVVVIDDASTDESVAVLNEYA